MITNLTPIKIIKGLLSVDFKGPFEHPVYRKKDNIIFFLIEKKGCNIY